VEEQLEFAQEGERRKRGFIVLKDGNYKKKKRMTDLRCWSSFDICGWGVVLEQRHTSEVTLFAHGEVF